MTKSTTATKNGRTKRNQAPNRDRRRSLGKLQASVKLLTTAEIQELAEEVRRCCDQQPARHNGDGCGTTAERAEAPGLQPSPFSTASERFGQFLAVHDRYELDEVLEHVGLSDRFTHAPLNVVHDQPPLKDVAQALRTALRLAETTLAGVRDDIEHELAAWDRETPYWLQCKANLIALGEATGLLQDIDQALEGLALGVASTRLVELQDAALADVERLVQTTEFQAGAVRTVVHAAIALLSSAPHADQIVAEYEQQQRLAKSEKTGSEDPNAQRSLRPIWLYAQRGGKPWPGKSAGAARR